MIENKENKTDISPDKNLLWKYFTIVLVLIVIVGGFIFLKGNNLGASGTGSVINIGEGSNVNIGDDAILGNINAKVTIIEFSDYECPYCRRFWSQTLPLIKSKYIDTGKVNFVYKDLPLINLHDMAMPAAEASECVKKQGGDEAFFKIHDKIFENQKSLTIDNLKSWAKDIGYDIGECLDSGEVRSEVDGDLNEAYNLKIRGTPYFFINEVPLNGAQPFNKFQKIIESELAKV